MYSTIHLWKLLIEFLLDHTLHSPSPTVSAISTSACFLILSAGTTVAISCMSLIAASPFTSRLRACFRRASSLGAFFFLFSARIFLFHLLRRLLAILTIYWRKKKKDKITDVLCFWWRHPQNWKLKKNIDAFLNNFKAITVSRWFVPLGHFNNDVTLVVLIFTFCMSTRFPNLVNVFVTTWWW